LQKLIKKNLVDYLAMDVKAPIEITNYKLQITNFYEKVVGAKVNLDDIKKSIEIIMQSGLDYEFRTTVVPSLHTPEDILQIAQEIRGAKRYYLQQFRPAQKLLDENFRKVKPYSLEILNRIRYQIKDYFGICEVRS
jgi:pyruvate formate lyase activating enzyme